MTTARKTMVTELVTGLGMLGHSTLAAALEARSAAMVSMSPAMWDDLAGLWAGGSGALRPEFETAWANGQAFLLSADGLRGRHPLTIEWKGSHRAPGDEVAPIDLRVDHVYLVSCKYLSKILINPSPAHLFDRLLKGGHGARGGHWYEEVAPDEHQALYESVRSVVPGLPDKVGDLSADDRRQLAQALSSNQSSLAAMTSEYGRERDQTPRVGGSSAWPGDGAARYAELAAAVSARSAVHWSAQLGSLAEREGMLWRLLRIGATPYFVLGSSKAGNLRLRIATAWDWRQRFELRGFEIAPGAGGQPTVTWAAFVRSRDTGQIHEVRGHVEIRWSHGRFSGPPEAKVYLDTPHAEVPGYFPLR